VSCILHFEKIKTLDISRQTFLEVQDPSEAQIGDSCILGLTVEWLLFVSVLLLVLVAWCGCDGSGVEVLHK
jgi:hypothetical protein